MAVNDIGSAIALTTAVVAVAAAIKNQNYANALATDTVSVQELQANPNVPKAPHLPLPYTPPGRQSFFDSLFNHPPW